MKIVPDWREILRRAWSVRLMLLAGLLSGIEVMLPSYADALPRGMFAGLTVAAVAGALIARVVAQRGLR